MPHTLGLARTALLPITCSSEPTAQRSMGSAPSKAIINSSYLQSPTLHITVAKHPKVIAPPPPSPQNNQDSHYKCLKHWDQPVRPSSSSLHVESTAQRSMGSAPSTAIIHSSYLQSHTLHVQLAPTEPLQMELPDYQQESKQLPNTPRSLAPPPPPPPPLRPE